MTQLPEKNRIDRLKKILDSRVERNLEQGEVPLAREQNFQVSPDWQHDSTGATLESAPVSGDTTPTSLFPEKHSSLPKKVFLTSLGFFVFALIVATFIYLRGANTISSDNIAISVAGPISIDGGQELDLDVTVKNQNNVDLALADLRVTYPDGTRNPDNVALDQQRTTDSLGDIRAGQEVTKRIRAVLFGQENRKKEITLNVEYRVKGSNAILKKEKKIEIALASAPVTLTVDSLKEINSNQDIEFTVSLVSNSPQILKNLLVKADYGFGFTFSGATPQPISGQNLWSVGDVRPGEKRTIKIRGKIEGQDGEERSFRFASGLQGIVDKKALEPEFVSTVQVVAIKKPFVGVSLALDGNTDDTYSVQPGKNIRADITWTNNLPAKVSNAKILVTLTGPTLDKNSVQAENGFYKSADNSIVWDQTTNSALATLQAGDTGRVSFSFASLLPQIGSFDIFKNGEITITVSVQGNRTEDTQVPETLVSGVVKKVRVNSELALSPRILHSAGPFVNTGPIPPKAEKATTYTVVWTVTNNINDMRDVKVTGTLPPYVQWLSAVSPSSENVTFNQTGGEIVWNLGEVPAGAGYSSPVRQVSFQVSLLPSVSQVGASPIIMNEMKIEGIDRFTNTSLSLTKPAMTTRLTTDPAFRSGDETVVR